MGPAKDRDPDAVRRDVRRQYVSREAAFIEYGVTIAEGGEE
jgi:N-methylhydantoinase B/oxoprolinase/acetone carboxylase alpha subunit